MSVLILKNVSNEGPGTIEDYLKGNYFDYKIIDLSKGEALPLEYNFQYLILLGGPMSVNDTDKIPYIKHEIEFIEKSILSDKKILGICLGAQIIAKALDANVYRGIKKEIGWFDIEFSYSGMLDQNIRKLARHPNVGDIWKKIKVFQWHGETFDLPKGAVHLASSQLYPNQAFRYGKGVYAFQFHIEVTDAIINDWLKDEDVDLSPIMLDTKKLFITKGH